MKTNESMANLEQAKLAEAEILAECDRLGGAIPYGVCAQTPLATLRALKSPAEARAFYRQWREIGENNPVFSAGFSGRPGFPGFPGLKGGIPGRAPAGAQGSPRPGRRVSHGQRGMGEA